MPAILQLTDGTIIVNLISDTFGFHLQTWNRTIINYKGGGTFQDSSLADGRRLVDKKFTNGVETLVLKANDTDQDRLLQDEHDLLLLLEKASNFWTAEGQDEPVWIVAKASRESNTRYAIIQTYRIPELPGQFEASFLQPGCLAALDTFSLIIEREQWLSNPPGQSTQITDLTSVQAWQFEALWANNTALPGSRVESIIQTVNGDIYASDVTQILRSQDNGAIWGVVTGVPTICEALLQTANGNIYAGDDGQILRSIDGGATWPVNTVLPTGVIRALLQVTNGDIYAGDDGQILRSQDNGASWGVVSTDPTDDVEVLFQAANGDIYAGESTRVWVSRDGGATWDVSLGGTAGFVTDIIQLANGNLLACSVDEVWQSSDNGIMWGIAATGAPIVNAITMIIAADGTLFMTDTDVVLTSVNNGLNWVTETTLPTAQTYGLLQTADGNIYAGEDGDIFRRVVSTTQMGNSDLDRVFVANKQNEANLTHIKIDDGGAFTDIFPMTSLPTDLLPAIPAVDDAIYFGIDEALVDQGVFGGLAFDLSEIALGVTITWEFWEGFWSAVTVRDNTDNFVVPGIVTVHWRQASVAWAKVAVDGITAYWLRARVSAISGTPAPPTQQNRSIYAFNLAYIEIDSVLGDIDAIVKIEAANVSSQPDGDVNLKDNRAIAGLRSTTRGEDFAAYLNASDQQVPIGLTVTLGGSTTFVTRTSSPTGRVALYNPVGVEAMANRVTFTLETTLARDYYGEFRAFLRGRQTLGSVGDITFRLQVTTGSGGVVESGNIVSFASTAVNNQLVDLGRVSLPASTLFLTSEVPDQTTLIVQAASIGAGPEISISDIVLIPVDEWSIDALSILGDITFVRKLSVDSLDNPKISIRALVKETATNEIVAVYQTIANGKAVLHPNITQRLWFLFAEDRSNIWLSQPGATHRVTIFKNQRYLAARGDQ